VARIAGVDLPRDKRVDVALRYIYGIGPTRAFQIVDGAGIDGGTKVREVAQDIKRKIEIGSYQGIRHRRSLPVRGQRTHTNARTRKGPRKTVAGKKKAGKK